MGNQYEKIRFLTSNFNELQGLRIIPFGLFLMVPLLGRMAGTPWTGFMHGWGLLVTALLIALYGLIMLYYRHQFGDVKQKESKKDRSVLWFGFFAFIAAFVLDIVLTLPMSLTWLMVGVLVLLDGLRGARRYGFVIVGALIALSSFWPIVFGTYEGWDHTILYALIGTGLILAGIFEHWRFLHAFKSVQQLGQHG